MFLSSSAGQVSLIQLRVLEFVAASGVLFVLLGGIDYLYRKHQYYRELSMSTDEVRREFRETEGDPHFKAERSAIHEELLAQDVATRIRKCKVVLVKTH